MCVWRALGTDGQGSLDDWPCRSDLSALDNPQYDVCCIAVQWPVLVQLASKFLHALLLKPGNSFLLSSEALILLAKAPVHECISLAQLPVFHQQGLLSLQVQQVFTNVCTDGVYASQNGGQV